MSSKDRQNFNKEITPKIMSITSPLKGLIDMNQIYSDFLRNKKVIKGIKSSDICIYNHFTVEKSSDKLPLEEINFDSEWEIIEKE